MAVLTMLLTILNFAPASDPATATTSADSVTARKAKPSADSDERAYVVLLTKGPAFIDGETQPGMADHVKFIKGLHADDVVPLAGPLFEGNDEVFGLLYFVRAASVEEARDVVMKEPLVREKVVKISSIWMFLAGVGDLD